jgi:hypothetical protein
VTDTHERPDDANGKASSVRVIVLGFGAAFRSLQSAWGYMARASTTVRRARAGASCERSRSRCGWSRRVLAALVLDERKIIIDGYAP